MQNTFPKPFDNVFSKCCLANDENSRLNYIEVIIVFHFIGYKFGDWFNFLTG